MKKISLEDIDYTLQYEGYYWYSNKQRPELVNQSIITKDIFKKLPFIVEGNLYCSSNQVSINIKNIDGAYVIYQCILADLPKNQYSLQEYIAHDLEGVSKIKMLQYWKEGEADDLLAGMTTLIPAWQAFQGFIK